MNKIEQMVEMKEWGCRSGDARVVAFFRTTGQ
jgi:hypothetical protein